MTFEQAYRRSRDAFPFPDYMPPVAAAFGYRTIAETVLDLVPTGSRVLDFGCGPCDKTAVLQDLGYRCSGYDDLMDAWHREGDNIEKIIAFAARTGIDLRIAEHDAPLPFHPGEFDLVMAHDILEHLHNSPRQFLLPLVDLLVPGGLLYLSVPNAANLRKRILVATGRSNHAPFNDYYWYPGDWRGHVREYVKADLHQLADNLGLEIVQVAGCDHMLEVLPGGRLGQRIWKTATSRVDSLKDSVMLIARKPANWTEPEAPPDADRFKKATH